MTKAQITSKTTRLYPTEKEAREYRQSKERYGIRDSVVVKCASCAPVKRLKTLNKGAENLKPRRSC